MNNDNKVNDQQTIRNAEIITPSEQSAENTASPAAFDINAYNATLEIVRRRLTIIEKAKTELTKLKEMYNDFFLNDANFQEVDKIVKDAMKKRKDVQARLTKQPEAAQINGKIKDLKTQLKDNEISLSDELMEYYKTSGVTEIEDADGNVQEFTIIVKLKGNKKAE